MRLLLKRYVVLLMLLCCMISCLTGCGAKQDEQYPPQEETQVTDGEADNAEPDPEKELNEEDRIGALFSECAEMTYCIFTSNENKGTGFLYNGSYVITNAHVLYEADDFYLKDIKGNELKGSVVFKDDAADIAVIRLDEKKAGSVRFGDSDDVAVGDQLLMIGNPYDGEPFSYCTGKRLELDEQLHQQVDRRDQYIPLDADIVSGYSGGPAFNMSGELIGISNAAYIGDLSEYDFDHLSLIIPINRVRDLIDANCN